MSNNILAIVLGCIVLVAAYNYQQESLKSQMLHQLSTQAGAGQLPVSARKASPGLQRAVGISRDFIEQKNYELALLGVEQLLADSPADVALHLYAGVLAERCQLWQNAQKHFETVRINSEEYYQNALQRLALIYFQQGEDKKARQMINDFLLTTEQEYQREWAFQLQALF